MPSTEDNFNSDLKDVHLIYDYDAQDDQGNPEKWRYEMWFYSFDRIVYAIHGGPMAGRKNYQKAEYQCKLYNKKNHVIKFRIGSNSSSFSSSNEKEKRKNQRVKKPCKQYFTVNVKL